MLSKKVLKDIQSLSLKKNRDETGLFVAEGPKVVEELLQAVPQQVQSIYATENWSGHKDGVELISEEDLQRLSLLKTPNQVVAVLRKLPVRLPETSGFVLYLDTIQDPGNLGTIIRIADWFGITDVVCSRGCADVYNPKVVQSTMASIARVNVYEDRNETWLAEQTSPIFAASLHGENLYSLPKTKRGILIIGNESKGIRPGYLQLATNLVTIPRRGEAESLNAAVATGILLSHLLA